MIAFVNHWELLVILAVILLLFGHRLPGMARSLGSGITEFKRGLKEGSSKSKDDDPPAGGSKKQVTGGGDNPNDGSNWSIRSSSSRGLSGFPCASVKIGGFGAGT